MRTRCLTILGLLCTACVTIGCDAQRGGGGAAMKDEAAKFLLSDEPDHALCISEAREAATDGREIVLFGRIGGVADPWTPGQAAFVIVDPTADMGHDHQCDDGCAFCRNKTDPTSTVALVRFLDAGGDVLPVDSRKLFKLSAGQMVVVRGQAVIDPLGHLMISATGMYVRR
jgi:hypothetical protein